MNLTDSETLELNELCSALADGRATDAQRARLAQMLASSADARRFYVRAMSLSASLFSYASEMQSEAPDARVIVLKKRPAALWWTLAGLAAAAEIMVAIWFGDSARRQHSEELADNETEVEESVARLSGGKDIQWDGAALAIGDALRRGQQIKLRSGFAEITFDCGARVELEGPASLELNSAWDAVLERGTLTAKVPHEAVGFRIENPAVEVVDLGTEFSMIADGNGAAEVLVLEGAVEASASDANGRLSAPVTLREKQASRFARGGRSDIRDREQKFARLARQVSFERAARAPEYVHWSFDDAEGPAIRADLSDKMRGSFDARLEPAAAAAHIVGLHGNALHLDGATFATAPLPRPGKRAARTIAFWTRVPAGASLDDAGAMLAWQLPGKSARLATISWNADPTLGALGAVSTGIGRNSRVGTTSLRDGQWHHLAVVLPASAHADGRMQVKCYVDGRLEGGSTRGGGRHRAIVDGAQAGNELWIGRAPAAGRNGRSFRGDIDELFIADRELAPHEIRYLLRENRPSPADLLASE